MKTEQEIQYGNNHQAHGFSLNQVEEIRKKQIEKTVPMIAANSIDTIIDRYWKEQYQDYKISVYDRGHYHVIQESREFDPQTGERVSFASVQIYELESFAFMKKNGGFTGMITHIIHVPD